ncbi:terminase small subunit [Frigidibacter sp. MR17.24]|uniref:terminase small subunit n=1 Tax=Frigidibacter sp. MR17.24 TaxID=3127345 RepID=UPI003012C098
MDFDDLIGKNPFDDPILGEMPPTSEDVTSQQAPEGLRAAASALPIAEMPETVSESALARLLGVSASRVQRLARDGVLVRSGRGKYALEESVRRYAEKLREGAARAGRPSAGGDDLKAERLRLTRAQADREEARVARERGELVPAAEVTRQWASILRDVRAGLLAVPSRFGAAHPHMSPHDIAGLTDEIKRALEGLADGNA